MKKKRDDNDEDDDNDEMMIVKKVVSHSWAEFYFVNIYDFLKEREISRTSFPWAMKVSAIEYFYLLSI